MVMYTYRNIRDMAARDSVSKVRISAIRQLDPNITDDKNILVKIAKNDKTIQVRIAATKQLDIALIRLSPPNVRK